MVVSRTRVELHIEELVLEGFAPRDRHRIAHALERELGAALSSANLDALADHDRNVAVRDAGQFQMRSAQPETVGRQVAKTAFDALNGGRRGLRRA